VSPQSKRRKPHRPRPPQRGQRKRLVCLDCATVVYLASTPERGLFYVGHDGRVHGSPR
jgi:hypothetical protein